MKMRKLLLLLSCLIPISALLTSFNFVGESLSTLSTVSNGPINQFPDVTADVGISMSHRLPDVNNNLFIIGQAWGDYDADGWVDLYLTGGNGPNKLYRNNGNGTFSLASAWATVALSDSFSSGANFVDFDNDGLLDLYVVTLGENHLFRNIGDSNFEDVSVTSNLNDDGNGESSAWADFNSDGLIDTYVVNYGCNVPTCTYGSRDGLYFNDGDGTFTDVTAALVVTQTSGPGFAASSVDFDNDGDLDLYVVNDKFYGNVLWRNDGAGCGLWCFTDVSESSASNVARYVMGIAVGDYDNDFDLDFFFTDIGPSFLLQNQVSQGNDFYTDVSSAAGVNFDAVGWGTVFLDYNNDGWLDIYQSVMTGIVSPTNRLFENAQDETFNDVSDMIGPDHDGLTLGVAYADYDRDGWLDIVVGNYTQDYRLYRNAAGQYITDGNWLSVNLIGSGPIDSQAIGSRVYMTTTGGLTRMQEVKNGSSLGSGNSLALHFGIGSEEISSLRIDWTNGSSTIIDGSELPLNGSWYHQFAAESCTAAMTVSDGNSLTTQFGGLAVYTHTIQNDGNCRDGFFLNWESTSATAYTTPAFLWLEPGETQEIAISVVANGVSGDETYLHIGSVIDESITETRYNQLTITGTRAFLPIIRYP